MLPKKRARPPKRTVTIYVLTETLDAAGELAKAHPDRFRSRNEALIWWLEIGRSLAQEIGGLDVALDRTRQTINDLGAEFVKKWRG